MLRRTFLKNSLASLFYLAAGSITRAKAAPVQAEPVLGADHIHTPVRRIAFGSCAQQDHPQPIWTVIGADQPDLFLFIGDNIYADTEDMKEMARKYKLLGTKPELIKFRS